MVANSRRYYLQIERIIMAIKVGIITWHHYGNFGSALQAFALQTTLEKCGYEAKIINYRGKKYNRIDWIKDGIKKLINQSGRFLKNKCYYVFIHFQSKYFKQTKIVFNTKQLAKLARKFDYVVCGSDQIWAPNVFNPIYLASFVKGDYPRKVSYAASIGLNDIPIALVPEYQDYLKDFTAIGIREKVGQELLLNKCGLQSTVVLDPTMLIDCAEYTKVERKPSQDIPVHYIFCYFLNENNEYEKIIRQYAKEKDIRLIGVSRAEKDYEWMEKLEGIGPAEFLWLIHHAEVVLTDSYHGTIFSMLFHKQFLTFERFKNTDEICQNSRIYQLNDYFDLSKQIVHVEGGTVIKDVYMDYDKFERKLNELRNMSIGYLRKALEK